MRSFLLIPLVLVSGACSKKSDSKEQPVTKDEPKAKAVAADQEVVAGDDPVADPKPDPTPAHPDPADDGCTRAVERLWEISAAAGNTTGDAAKEIAICKSEEWTAELLACIATVTDLRDFSTRCAKLVFPEGLDMKIGRTFRGRDDNSAADPKVSAVDGDFLVYDEARQCGLLFRVIEPTTAAFLVCGDTVYAGPLTLPEEIDEVMAQVSDASAAGHDLVMDIMNRYPTGRRVKVYDRNGTPVLTE